MTYITSIMPRENRKRGKKHKKTNEQPAPQHVQLQTSKEPEPRAGPSWLVSAPDTETRPDPEAPYGYVEAEVKAYFRTVDLQIRDWQNGWEAQIQTVDDVDPNEGMCCSILLSYFSSIDFFYHLERHMFFVAALTEMTEKEKQLATDPDCSNILERMTYSMDDFVRRVFLDRLTGS